MNNLTVNKILGRLDVTVPEQEFEAGRPGIISILIRNPFDSPIEILEVAGPRSPHLQEGSSVSEPSRLSSKSSLGNWVKRLVGRAYEIQFSGITLEFPQAKRDITINAAKNSMLKFDRELEPYENVTINADEGANVTIAPQSVVRSATKEAIQRVEPHCDSVMYVSLSTKSWLLFKPTILQLNSQLRYRIEGAEKSQVISTAISVKPPIRAVVIGALVGAVLGSVAKLFQTPAAFTWPNSLILVGSAATMSLIATIALSRKSGTQGFITVEDFYGGFAVGALIGYGGSKYFEEAIAPNQGMEPTR
jgi:hypothetical protein